MRNVFYDSSESLLIFTQQTTLNKQSACLGCSDWSWRTLELPPPPRGWKYNYYDCYYHPSLLHCWSSVINNGNYSWATIVLLIQTWVSILELVIQIPGPFHPIVSEIYVGVVSCYLHSEGVQVIRWLMIYVKSAMLSARDFYSINGCLMQSDTEKLG